MRRIVTALSALAAVAMTLMVTASVASARPLEPIGGGATEPTSQPVLHHHAGLLGWQIALIVAGAVVLVSITGTLLARRARQGSRRPAIS
jgi:hypothetical protein